jgi:serine/threonine-protein kinase
MSASAIGKYRIHEKIGAGGMGSVHLGLLHASGGFRRIVAIKRLLPHLAEDAEFVGAFLDEARLASRIHHPNVVPVLDVVAENGEVFIVLEHVLGVSLASLVKLAQASGSPVPPRIAASIAANVLHGLQAAHEATSDDRTPLHLIHRDVSPQNILLGKDGVARLIDFGVAKAVGRSQSTAEGRVKGKQSYMAPEHLLGSATPASDIYSASIVLWELLTLRRLFIEERTVAERIAGKPVDPPGSSPFAAVVMRGLQHDQRARFSTPREMAIALEEIGIATPREVGEWVSGVAGAQIEERHRLVERAESAAWDSLPVVTEARVTEARSVDVQPETSGEGPSTRPRRARFGPKVAGFGVALALVGAVFAAVGSFRARAPRAVEGAGAPPAASEDALPAPTPSSPAALPATAVADPRPPPTASADKPKPAVAVGARPARRPSQPCKPYSIDKDGRTVFNEACLR